MSITAKQRLTADSIRGMKQAGEKIAVLTSYDASMTAQCEQAGIDVLLVGDSLGMVIQGHDSTLPVTIQDMVYHTRHVARVRQRALLIIDMPYKSYTDNQTALESARQLIDAGGDMVKLEGGERILEVVMHLIKNGIAVCGHLGLLPQSVEELGGYKVQGREQAAADKMLDDALKLQQAGVDMIVLECIPATLAKRITDSINIPTIGIGAGADCDGQVLVIYDLLGITPGKRPRFTKDFVAEQPQGKGISDAIKAYVSAVKDGSFPTIEHSFK